MYLLGEHGLTTLYSDVCLVTPNQGVGALKRITKQIWGFETEPIKDFSVFFDFKTESFDLKQLFKSSDSHTCSFQGPLNWYKLTPSDEIYSMFINPMTKILIHSVIVLFD